MQAQLPSDFPAQVSDTIFEGVQQRADRLHQQGQVDGKRDRCLRRLRQEVSYSTSCDDGIRIQGGAPSSNKSDFGLIQCLA